MGMKKFKNISGDLKDTHVADMRRTEKLFLKQFGVRLFVTHGTLLGVIRDSDFIPYDNDIDMAYLSKYNKSVDIRSEWKEIVSTLNSIFKSRGSDKRVKKDHMGHMHFWALPSLKTRLDVHTAWVRAGKMYHSRHIYANLPANTLLPFRRWDMRGEKLLVPNKSGKLLEYWYGHDWKKPKNKYPTLTEVHKKCRKKVRSFLKW